MFRIFVIFVIMALVTADAQDCLKSIQARLIGYKTILKDSLKANQNKNEPQAEQEGNKEVETLIDDRANSPWGSAMQGGIQTGSNIITQNNPIAIMNTVANNGGMQAVQQVMGQFVTQSNQINGLLETVVNIMSNTTSQVINIGGNRQSGSPSLKAMLTDISETFNSLNGIIKVIDEIFSEK